jgi:putative transposase
MDKHENLSHSRWECKYHAVFTPKCRRKALYGHLRQHLGEVLCRLAEQKERRIEEELCGSREDVINASCLLM